MIPLCLEITLEDLINYRDCADRYWLDREFEELEHKGDGTEQKVHSKCLVGVIFYQHKI